MLLFGSHAIACQGSCKPSAMELAPIAKVQPSLARYRMQSYDSFLDFEAD